MWRQLLDWWRAPDSPYRFDEAYLERVVLADGGCAQLRVVRPADRVLVEEGFQELSGRSRYHRFMGARSKLSASELRYLSEFDGVDHFALGAVAIGASGRERGLGIARFVRLRSDSRTAEPAVAVLDAMQGRGLGRLLVERLVAAARERGVERFRAQVLTGNAAARALLRRLAPHADYRIDDGALEVTFALTGPPASRPAGAPASRPATGITGLQVRPRSSRR